MPAFPLDEGAGPASMLVVRHVVVIATTGDRPTLLNRALRSVAAQTRPPDRVILVIDRLATQHDVGGGAAPPEALDVPIEVLRNRRTPGAAGAWNTALDHLARTEWPLERVVVSFLDDDDWWEPDHLIRVEKCAACGAPR